MSPWENLPISISVLTKTIHATVHKNLNISKKSAMWVSKLFNKERNERVRVCESCWCCSTVAPWQCSTILTLWMSWQCSSKAEDKAEKQAVAWKEQACAYQRRCPCSKNKATTNANYIMDALDKFFAKGRLFECCEKSLRLLAIKLRKTKNTMCLDYFLKIEFIWLQGNTLCM